MTKRNVLVLGTVGLLLLVIGVTRTWVSGTVADAVLQNSHVSVTGTSAAPAVLATALVAAAGVIASLTTARVARVVAAVVAALAALLAIGATIVVIKDPAAAVRDRAGSLTGHTGGVSVSAHLSAWPWVSMLGAVLLLCTGVLAVLGARRWSGLSASYDAPAGTKRKTVSDWDRLSQGEDPTDDDRRGLTE